MSKILCLGKSGFGKSLGFFGSERRGIKGIMSKGVMIVRCSGKAVAVGNKKEIFKEYSYESDYDKINYKELFSGAYNTISVTQCQINARFGVVANIVKTFNATKGNGIDILIIEDFNYLAQDFYMANARKGGWDCPKNIGLGMATIFAEIDKVELGRRVYVTSHYDTETDENGNIKQIKMKTIGSMVDKFITPEGKFDIVLIGEMQNQEGSRIAKRCYVYEGDETSIAKDCLDAFPIEWEGVTSSNDMWIIDEAIEKATN